MDATLTAAARALAIGNVLGALNRVSLRRDPQALALHGIAMAQLGELPRALSLLRRARRGLVRDPLAQARCRLAESEVLLAMRELQPHGPALDGAIAQLELHGDRLNAQYARLIAIRQDVLLGRLTRAEDALRRTDLDAAPPMLHAVRALTQAELALRALRPREAHAALRRASDAAARAHIPMLQAEIDALRDQAGRPAARCVHGEEPRTLGLTEVEELLDGDALIVDACRRRIGQAGVWRSLARRPVLLALARSLGIAGSSGVPRERLIAEVFRQTQPDETHRARLRVEIGRLRALMRPLADIVATPEGYALRSADRRPVCVLLPPIDGDEAALLALLADGRAWSTSALALALGESQRNVQRALADLLDSAQVRGLGSARTRRWIAAPLSAFTTILLLPAGDAHWLD